MPQPALTVFLIIAAIAIVVVLIAVIVIALRAQRRRKLAQTLEKRRDDEVQYAFIVNPSKPQAEARRSTLTIALLDQPTLTREHLG